VSRYKETENADIMTIPKEVTFSTATWWENEKDIRAIKMAAEGTIFGAISGIIIMVIDRDWAILTTAGAQTIILMFALFGAKGGLMGTRFEDKFLFNWNEVPGNYNGRLIEYLEQWIDASWVKTADIEKIDNGKTIIISSGKNYFLLRLNYEQTKVDLKFDDVRADTFKAKTENGKFAFFMPAPTTSEIKDISTTPPSLIYTDNVIILSA
jgi:hypothetical protein